MMAIMAAGMLLMLASHLKKTNTNPMAVRIIAGLAAAAALFAVAKGMEIMNLHGQQMQGMMFLGLGGIILVQAALVMMDPGAGETADTEMKALKDMNGAEMRTELGATKPADPTNAQITRHNELFGKAETRFGTTGMDSSWVKW